MCRMDRGGREVGRYRSTDGMRAFVGLLDSCLVVILHISVIVAVLQLWYCASFGFGHGIPLKLHLQLIIVSMTVLGE